MPSSPATEQDEAAKQFPAKGVMHLLPPVTSSGVPREKDPLGEFEKFMFIVWRHLRLPKPSRVQREIANWLQFGPRRSITLAFRGVGKSWITAAFAVWLLYMNPQLRVMAVSANKERADNFVKFCMQLLMSMDVLSHLRPKDEQRNSAVAFDVAPAMPDQNPSLRAAGITGQITGGRADVIIPDDVEVPKNSLTQKMRDHLAELVKEFDAVLKPGGCVRYLGTPQTEMTLYNLLRNRGYTPCIWPARYPNQRLMQHYGPFLYKRIRDEIALKPDLEGRSTDPGRFSDEDLMEREASYGRSGFQLQFMLSTALSDAEKFPLKVSDLIVMRLNPDLGPELPVWAAGPQTVLDHLPNVALQGDRFHGPMQITGQWVPYTGSAMSIDPSGRGKDELAYAVGKQLNSRIYVPACSGLRGGYSDANLRTLAEIAKKHKVNHIIIESNFGDGMFTKLFSAVLRDIHPCVVEEVRHSTQKEKRIIDTLEPVMNQHRLILDEQVIEDDYRSVDGLPAETAHQYMLIHQLTRITTTRGALAHDDRLDALAMLVAYWVEAMAQDVNRNMQERQGEALKAELGRTLAMARLGYAQVTGHNAAMLRPTKAGVLGRFGRPASRSPFRR